MNSDIDSLLKNYHPNQSAVELVKTTPIALIVGISGSGKGTIRQRLFETGNYTNFISHTTRAPRENNGVLEKNGVEYYFVSIEKAVEMLKAGEFIEAKHYSGNIYGTTISELLRAKESGKIALNDIEVQGINEYLSISSELRVVFIVPPSYEIWINRLTSRYEGKIDQHDFNHRLETARLELETAINNQYFIFIINDDLETAVHDARNAIERGAIDDSHARDVAKDILSKIDTQGA